MVKKLMGDTEKCEDEPEILNSHQCELIEMRPYPYQVGGHNCILVYDKETICKPLIDQEHHVYAHFPNELKSFIPRCRGINKRKTFKKLSFSTVLCFALKVKLKYHSC